MALSINNYIEHDKHEISAKTATNKGEYLWVYIGNVTSTISLEQAEQLLSTLGKAIADYKNDHLN